MLECVVFLQKQLVCFLGHFVFFLVVGRSITLAVRFIVAVFAVIAIFIVVLPLFVPILTETALVLAVLRVACRWIRGRFFPFIPYRGIIIALASAAAVVRFTSIAIPPSFVV